MMSSDNDFVYRGQFVAVIYACIFVIIAILDGFFGMNLRRVFVFSLTANIVISVFLWLIAPYFKDFFTRD